MNCRTENVSRKSVNFPLIIIFFFALYIIPNNLFASDILVVPNSLSDLDDYINNKSKFEEIKIKRINDIKLQLDITKSKAELYDVYSNLFNEYESYAYDSAYSYSLKMCNLALEMDNKQKMMESKLLMSYCTLSAGLFLEASEEMAKIDSTRVTKDQKIFLYSIYAKLYLDMAEQINVEPYNSDYNIKSANYSLAVIDMLGEDTLSAKPHWVNVYRCRHEYEKAIETLENYSQSLTLNERSLTLCSGGIGQFYLILGDTAKAVPYLCQTAISDIKAATKETPALFILANIAYAKGDIGRAYMYAKNSLNDANFYNARHRKIEVGSVLPIIETSRFDLIQHERNRFIMFTVLLSMLVISFFIAIVVIWKQIKQLRAARKVIQKQNDNLQEINVKLKEVNRIKDEYIGHFFTANSTLFGEIEEYQKMIKRKVISRQYHDLPMLVEKINVNKEREESLLSFDRIFLKIFPDFIQQFNEMFDDRDRIKVQSDAILTPELRIFALIRLGVTDSDKIAKLLNYSVNTINTYKTKVKNRSLIANDQFEIEIMKIESGKGK